jgi:PilZ domain
MEQEDCLISPLAMMEDSLGSLCTYKPLNLQVQVVDFLSGYTVRGVLQGFTPGEVTISVGEPVDEQRMVTVQLNSFSFEGQTLFCGPRDNQFEVHISIDDVEANGLRRAPRFPVKLSADLSLPRAEPVPVTNVDISSDGLGIELPVSVETGQPIAVTTGSVFVFATIRHCRQLSEGLFRAGAEMHHLFQRSVEIPADAPRLTFLQRAWGRRTSKGLGAPSPRLSPQLF